jgi:hypothetical protein
MITPFGPGVAQPDIKLEWFEHGCELNHIPFKKTFSLPFSIR